MRQKVFLKVSQLMEVQLDWRPGVPGRRAGAVHDSKMGRGSENRKLSRGWGECLVASPLCTAWG